MFLFVLADRGGYNFCSPVISELRYRGQQVICFIAKKLEQNLKGTNEEFYEYLVYSEAEKDLYETIKRKSFLPNLAIINSLITRDLEKANFGHSPPAKNWT